MTNSEAKTAKNWQRVSPVALVYFLLSFLNFATNLWPVLIPLIAGGEWVRDFFWDYAIYAIVSLSLIALFIKYWFFRFSHEDNCIHIRSGMLNRSRLTLSFDRVQQADIVQPFYFRPFGLATLGLESAGSAQKEVALPGIPYKYAAELKQAILAYKENNVGAGDIDIEQEEDIHVETYRLRLPPMEIARYGLMHNGLIFLLPLLAPLTQNPNLFQKFLSPLESTWIFDYLFHTENAGNPLLFIFGFSFLIFLFLAFIFFASVIVSLFRYWNYDLRRTEDQFQYRAGLATISTRGFKLHKLQKVLIVQGIVAKLLRRYTVTITKAGSSFAKQTSPQAQKQSFIVPVLDKSELKNFMDELDLPNIKWEGISRYYIVSRGTIISLLACGLASIFLINTDNSLLWLIPLSAFIYLAVWRQWSCWGVSHQQDWFATKTGFIGQKVTFVPAPKTQKIAIYQPIWLRRLSLSAFGIWSGAGAQYIPPISATKAEEIRDRLLFEVSHYKKRWL